MTPRVASSRELELLIDHIERNLNLDAPSLTRARYGHMGALICDAVLQAGLNYRVVVAPRVARMIRYWPSATSVSVFQQKTERYGLHEILHWTDPVKLTRIHELTDFLARSGANTVQLLAEFLREADNEPLLRAVSGVGPKTVDYMKILAGLPALAIDRHVQTFVLGAGVAYRGYDDAHGLLVEAAAHLSVDLTTLDAGIWGASQAPPMTQ